VDFEELIASRRLTLLTEAEITELSRRGFDIQLHTHRHRLPENDRDAKRELDDNRAVLAPLTGRPLNHLCYPSGVWSKALWPVLESEGVDTCTTCEPGLNSPETPPLAWSRFLDFQFVPQIVFEAEASGFAHIARQAARRCGGFVARRAVTRHARRDG
jgi:peptidoglycan/xylan/chitin deacetylase (PgdA/CDA1 family)